MDIYGTDINSNWNFTNGDINLVSDTTNLGQAIINRLNSDTDTYDMFYLRYGGELFEHMGDLNQENIHEYIRIEVEHILLQDPRIQNIECEVNKTDTNTIRCDLKIRTIASDDIVAFNLILSPDTPILISTENEYSDRI